MKILVITRALWRNDNGVGNSYSNIFQNIKDVQFAHVCCCDGESDNLICNEVYHISERRIVHNILDKRVPSGIKEEMANTINNDGGNHIILTIKRSRFQFLFAIRELIWKTGRWKSKELREFIQDFNPDIIFAQLQGMVYLNNLISYVKEVANKPLALYVWDDIYSLKRVSFSPIFWISRLLSRRSTKKLVKECELLYTISEEQKNEYSRDFNRDAKVLFKGYQFDAKQVCKRRNKTLKILYTGNLYNDRYKTLLSLCKELGRLNRDTIKAHIYIYSGTNLSMKEKDQLNIDNTSIFGGKISEKEVDDLQSEADVLLHIEPFSLKGSLACRLSFSTKLVDYFYHAKCIFAVGSERCSSIKYLKRNQCAIIAENVQEASKNLKLLLDNSEIIEEYSKKAWQCGCRNHQISKIQAGLLNDFNALIEQDKHKKLISE